MKCARVYVPFGLVLASAVLAAACSGGLASPLGPTTNTPAVTGGTTTIKGRTSAMGSTASVRPLAGPSATTHVCVTGTSNCADVDGDGNFTLVGNFSGDVQLQFFGPQGTVDLTVPDVQPGETVVVTVELNGATSAIRVVSRTGDDDVSEDGESEDDPSEDDESEDADDESEDDESEDDESEDDESEDDESEDDESEDDESEDDESEDDDSDDDAVTSTGR